MLYVSMRQYVSYEQIQTVYRPLAILVGLYMSIMITLYGFPRFGDCEQCKSLDKLRDIMKGPPNADN
jgi:hypothetical protein